MNVPTPHSHQKDNTIFFLTTCSVIKSKEGVIQISKLMLIRNYSHSFGRLFTCLLLVFTKIKRISIKSKYVTDKQEDYENKKKKN